MRFEMVMVPNGPKELKKGMLCRSLLDDSDSRRFYFLDEGMDLAELGMHEPVLPFIVSKDQAEAIEKDKVYYFALEDGGCCVAYPDELAFPDSVVSARQVLVNPEQIGMFCERSPLTGAFEPITETHINSIMSNDGWCHLEMVDEFDDPKRFANVPWGESVPEVKLMNGKCMISI